MKQILEDKWSDLVAAPRRKNALGLLPPLGNEIVPVAQPNRYERKRPARPGRRAASSRSISDDDIYALTEPSAHKLLCRFRWPATNGKPVCPECGSGNCSSIPSRRIFRCRACRVQFSVTTGTTWHSHKLPLRRILILLFHFALARQGVAAAAISDRMKINTKTAQILCHKVREAIAYSRARVRLSGVVEIDGVFFGASKRRPNRGRAGGAAGDSARRTKCMISLVQRGGPVAIHISNGENSLAVLEAVRAHIEPGTIIMTDEHEAYTFLRFYFELNQVNHSVKYADGEIFTNNAESFHARVRRAQRVHGRLASGPDFDLYMQELAHRHSTCDLDTRALWETLISITMQAPPSLRFQGYFRRG